MTIVTRYAVIDAIDTYADAAAACCSRRCRIRYARFFFYCRFFAIALMLLRHFRYFTLSFLDTPLLSSLLFAAAFSLLIIIAAFRFF